jgi:hypothetical protein
MSLRIRPRFKRLHTYIHATHVNVCDGWTPGCKVIGGRLRYRWRLARSFDHALDTHGAADTGSPCNLSNPTARLTA